MARVELLEWAVIVPSIAWLVFDIAFEVGFGIVEFEWV